MYAPWRPLEFTPQTRRRGARVSTGRYTLGYTLRWLSSTTGCARAATRSWVRPPEYVSLATSSSDELSYLSSCRYLTVSHARRAAEGGQVAAQGRAGRRALLC
eukprot:scaffold124113_cov63-Phaeocystis_antarctica.AAC.7